MRGRCLVLGAVLLALLLLLGVAQAAWTGPFTEVPSGHWAYPACQRLARLGVLPAERESTFSADPRLTRFEFGMAILAPLTELDRAVAAMPPDAPSADFLRAIARALALDPRLSEGEIVAAASDLRRLSAEFADVLRALNFDPDRAARALQAVTVDRVRQWRLEVLSGPAGGMALAPSPPDPADGLRMPLGPGTVALTYDRNFPPPALLDQLAASAARGSDAAPDVAGAEPALRDPVVSRLRTAYEYGLGSALTLSLAYEQIGRRGQGLEPLDRASLASLGVGYRLSPSTSVTLSYSLLEYSSRLFDLPPLRDRVAETAVSIGF